MATVLVNRKKSGDVNLWAYLFQLLALSIFDGGALWLVYMLFSDGVWPIATPLGLIVILVNVVILFRKAKPIRWQIPVLSIVILMVLFPVVFTIYSGFTNYSDGHILTKQQSIDRLGFDLFVPEGGQSYQWTPYKNAEDEIALWLVTPEGETFLALPGGAIEAAQPGEGIIGPADEDGIPQTLEGFTRLTRAEKLRELANLDGVEFGEPPEVVSIRSLNEATPLVQRYTYDAETDAITDNLNGGVYFGDETYGYFTAEDGTRLIPGYTVPIGFRNFQRLFGSAAFSGPFFKIFLWTIVFAGLSVVTTFALGLLLSLAFNDPMLPGRKLIRSLLIIPYTIPGIIGVLIWRGLLNPYLGVVALGIGDVFGWVPPFLTDPFWVKVGIILVNLWLGYPYMMLITTGAIQSIPTDIYEAAEVDGANRWQAFWKLTLPLLLVSVGPLLIASFTYNFNNFTVIYAFNEGRPPIPGTPTPAGYSDILISYTYRIAFEGGGGSDYAYAAAITVIIFLITVAFTIAQFQFTRQWEEVSENV